MLCPCGCGETIHLRFMGERRPRWSLGSLSGRATVFPSIWRQAALTLPHPLDRAIIFVDGQHAEDRAKIHKPEHFVGRLRRNEELCVGRECIRTGRDRMSWDNKKKKHNK